jgi:hypothetical protein
MKINFRTGFMPCESRIATVLSNAHEKITSDDKACRGLSQSAMCFLCRLRIAQATFGLWIVRLKKIRTRSYGLTFAAAEHTDVFFTRKVARGGNLYITCESLSVQLS